MATPTTVHGRIDRALPALAAPDVALGLALLALLGGTFLFVQEPLVHEALHNGRHAVGAVCH